MTRKSDLKSEILGDLEKGVPLDSPELKAYLEAAARQRIDFYKTSGVRADLDFSDQSNDDNVSRTRQEYAAECDINTLMDRYEATGAAVTHVNRSMPMFIDTTELPGLQGAMDIFRHAAEGFNALPAQVRRQFDNDAGKFVEFAGNPENLEQMRAWGLAKPVEAPPGPIEVKVVPQPSPEPPPPTPPKA